MENTLAVAKPKLTAAEKKIIEMVIDGLPSENSRRAYQRHLQEFFVWHAGENRAAGIGLRQEHSAGTNVFNIYGLSPNPSNDAQMIAYVSDNNPNSATGTAGTRVSAISSGATFGSCS